MMVFPEHPSASRARASKVVPAADTDITLRFTATGSVTTTGPVTPQLRGPTVGCITMDQPGTARTEHSGLEAKGLDMMDCIRARSVSADIIVEGTIKTTLTYQSTKIPLLIINQLIN